MAQKQTYLDFDEYIRQGDPDKKEKASIWQTAIGLQAVDGLKTSDYLKDYLHMDLVHTNNPLIIGLIKVIGKDELSISQLMANTGLKHRPNFIEYHLNPAIKEGYVRLLYPQSPVIHIRNIC